MTREAEWDELAAALEGKGPDVLVNNAGGLLSAATLHEHTIDDWRRTIDLNLTSVFLGMRAVIRFSPRFPWDGSRRPSRSRRPRSSSRSDESSYVTGANLLVDGGFLT